MSNCLCIGKMMWRWENLLFTIQHFCFLLPLWWLNKWKELTSSNYLPVTVVNQVTRKNNNAIRHTTVSIQHKDFLTILNMSQISVTSHACSKNLSPKKWSQSIIFSVIHYISTLHFLYLCTFSVYELFFFFIYNKERY